MISVSINDFIGLKVGDKFNNLSVFTDQPFTQGDINEDSPPVVVGQQFLQVPVIVPIGTLFEVVSLNNYGDSIKDYKDTVYAKHIHFTYINDGVEYRSWFSVGSLNSRSCFMNFRVNNLEKLGI